MEDLTNHVRFFVQHRMDSTQCDFEQGRTESRGSLKRCAETLRTVRDMIFNRNQSLKLSLQDTRLAIYLSSADSAAKKSLSTTLNQLNLFQLKSYTVTARNFHINLYSFNKSANYFIKF